MYVCMYVCIYIYIYTHLNVYESLECFACCVRYVLTTDRSYCSRVRWTDR